MSELGSVYDPQRQLVKQQQEAIDPAMQAQEAGLMAAKNDAFQSINEGANRRGLFYSGVPLAEQAKYTGSTFLPAVANLRSKYQQQRFNLQDALNQIQKEQSGQAYGIRQKELDTEEQRRQFDAQLAAQRAAASGGGGGFSPSFGGGGIPGGGGGGGIPEGYTPQIQALYDRMFFKQDGSGKWSDDELRNDFNATLLSANRGNVNDQLKIQLYHANKPGLFGSTVRPFTPPRGVQTSGGVPRFVAQPTNISRSIRGIR
jgi:hypothetical protein